MEMLYFKKYKSLIAKGKREAAIDLCLYSIETQEQLNTIWKTGKVEMLH